MGGKKVKLLVSITNQTKKKVVWVCYVRVHIKLLSPILDYFVLNKWL